MYSQHRKYKMALIVADFCVTVTTLIIAEHVRPFLPGEHIGDFGIIPHYSIYLFAPLLLLVLFASTGAYDFKRIPGLSSQIKVLSFAYSLWIWIFAGILFFTFRETSRLLVIYFVALNYLAIVVTRFAIRWFIKKKLFFASRVGVLVVGTGGSAILAAKTIIDELGSVYQHSGFVDFEAPENDELPAPFFGLIEELPHIIQQHRIEVIIIAQPKSSDSKVNELINLLLGLPIRIYVVSHNAQLALWLPQVEQLGNMVFIDINAPIIQGINRLTKRILDITVSLVVLFITWPILVVIWIAIRIDSRGPAIFVAPRIGEGAKLFKMYKFRTMVMDAEKIQSQVTQNTKQGEKIYKVKDDPRVTRVGRVLRRTSLDELPQLFNVLIGEMSLVGPRPEQPFITKEYDRWQWQRILVPPGVTGWWQISGRSDLPMHLNTDHDVYYMRNYSIALDLKILFLTFFEVMKGRGAY